MFGFGFVEGWQFLFVFPVQFVACGLIVFV